MNLASTDSGPMEHQRMLMLLTGSSAAGKSTLARALPEIKGLVVHDFDEIGVPDGADKVWRHRALETWFQRALELQEQDQDLLLACQSPLGEALATPSADLLSGLAVCLIDCRDDDRLTRLGQRDDVHSEELLAALIGWAAFMRHHHRDPQYRQHIITDGSWSRMRWDRWTSWPSSDPRWSAATINTSDLDMNQSLGAYVAGSINRGAAHRSLTPASRLAYKASNAGSTGSWRLVSDIWPREDRSTATSWRPQMLLRQVQWAGEVH